MSESKPFCFVVMPFRPDLHYFYLYLKYHIEHVHHVTCERGDGQVLTIPLIEKINDYIRRADVIIADCTGRNANVFYELGIAYAHEKKVILITQDDISEAPSDIRHLEFIPYKLDAHNSFLERLDNALRNVFVYRYEELYERAKVIFHEFQASTQASVSIASKAVFVQRLIEAEQVRDLPSDDNDFGIVEMVLPKIVANTADMATMTQITTWMAARFSDETGEQ